MMDPKNIRLVHTGTVITTSCNLRCKLCCTGVLRLRELGVSYTYKRLLDTYDTYFKIIKHVGRFSLGGGEPLLRHDLADLIDHLMQFETQFDELEVITNGTIIPSERLLDSMSKVGSKMAVLVDKYGELSPVADKVGELLTERGIRNRVRKYYGEDCHCGGWVNLGDYSLKHPTIELQKELFKKCLYNPRAMKNGSAIVDSNVIDGMLIKCGREYSTFKEGKITEKDGLINILDPNKTIEQLQEEIAKFLDDEYTPACAYCNGFCKDSERFMPAEQLP